MLGWQVTFENLEDFVRLEDEDGENLSNFFNDDEDVRMFFV